MRVRSSGACPPRRQRHTRDAFPRVRTRGAHERVKSAARGARPQTRRAAAWPALEPRVSIRRSLPRCMSRAAQHLLTSRQEHSNTAFLLGRERARGRMPLRTRQRAPRVLQLGTLRARRRHSCGGRLPALLCVPALAFEFAPRDAQPGSRSRSPNGRILACCPLRRLVPRGERRCCLAGCAGARV